MIYTLDLKYSVEEATNYIDELKKNFSHLHWGYNEHHCDPRGIGSKNRMDNVHGWGLQTIYADPEFPYHCDIDPHDEGYEYFKDTPMVFGFFKRLKELFKNPYRSFVMSFPPNHHIGRWKSGSGPAHGKVFVPIKTNNETAIFSLEDTVQKVILEEGKIYLFDMTEHYGEIKNDGDSEITFITFNIPMESFNSALELKGIV